jgi:hypothetical protein
LTLIELLMVMGLMALMLGFGVGAIASIDIGNYGAGSLVRSTLRSTGNWSRGRQAPAQVRIDAAEGTLAAEGLMVVGTWHFESSPPRGAFGLNGELLDAVLVKDGFVGKALGLAGTPSNASYSIPVSMDPAFALSAGFQVQVTLRPELTGSGTILAIGDMLKIEATRNLGLKVTLSVERFDEESQDFVAAGRAFVSTEPGALTLDEWNRVLVSYDREHLSIFVEGIPVARLEETGQLEKSLASLVLGGGYQPWPGSLDNLVVSAVGAQELVVLPEGVSFAKTTPKRIVFAADGGLDRSTHSNPVEFELEYEDGRRETVRVNLYGTVE